MSSNVYAKFLCAPLRTKKALGISRELVTTRTTIVAFWNPPSGSKNFVKYVIDVFTYVTQSTEHKKTKHKFAVKILVFPTGLAYTSTCFDW